MKAATPAAKDSPLMIAWEAYKQTEEFKNTLHWALTIAPMIQAGDPQAERRRYELMPLEQREGHVIGALWAAFMQGFQSSVGPAGDCPKTEELLLPGLRRAVELSDQVRANLELSARPLSASHEWAVRVRLCSEIERIERGQS